MHSLFALLNPTTIIKSLGLLGILAIVFAESGLFFGFFLPGDSLLFTAGFLASQNLLPFWPLIIGTMIAAILGDSVGYAFGYKVGPKLFTKEDSLFFNRKHIERSALFFHTHGKKSLILARFVPVVRTFTPILAGVGKMKYKLFITYNAIGGILWAGFLTALGFFLGRSIPSVDKYLLPIILLIIILSIVPSAIELYKSRTSEKN